MTLIVVVAWRSPKACPNADQEQKNRKHEENRLHSEAQQIEQKNLVLLDKTIGGRVRSFNCPVEQKGGCKQADQDNKNKLKSGHGSLLQVVEGFTSVMRAALAAVVGAARSCTQAIHEAGQLLSPRTPRVGHFGRLVNRPWFGMACPIVTFCETSQ